MAGVQCAIGGPERSPGCCFLTQTYVIPSRWKDWGKYDWSNQFLEALLTFGVGTQLLLGGNMCGRMSTLESTPQLRPEMQASGCFRAEKLMVLTLFKTIYSSHQQTIT